MRRRWWAAAAALGACAPARGAPRGAAPLGWDFYSTSRSSADAAGIVCPEPWWANVSQVVEAAGTTLLHRLVSPTQYDKTKPSWPRPVVPRLSATITKVNQISTSMQTFEVNMYFRHVWNDPRLSWDPSEWCGVDNITEVPRHLLWVPDTFFATAGQVDTPEDEYYIFVYSNGDVLWSRRVIVTFSCRMDFSRYPFDTQECMAGIESYGHGPQVLNYELPKETDRFKSALLMAGDAPNSVGPYLITEVRAVRPPPKTIDGIAFSNIVYHFTFERDASKALMTLFFVLWCVVAVSFLGLYINPAAAPARVAMAIIAFLTLINLVNSVSREVPLIADILAIDLYFFACFLIVFGNILEFCFINYMSTRISEVQQKIDRRKKLRDKVSGEPDSPRCATPRRRGGGLSPAYRRKRNAAERRQVRMLKGRRSRRWREGELRSHFESLDPYHTGKVDRADLAALLLHVNEDKGAPLSEKQVLDVVRAGDGDATFREFCELVDVHIGEYYGPEASRSIQFCFTSWSLQDVGKFERRYRFWALGVFMMFNALWFPMVLIDDFVTSLIVGIVLCILVIVVWSAMFLCWSRVRETLSDSKKGRDSSPDAVERQDDGTAELKERGHFGVASHRTPRPEAEAELQAGDEPPPREEEAREAAARPDGGMISGTHASECTSGESFCPRTPEKRMDSSQVETYFEGMWYPSFVARVQENGQYTILWNDGTHTSDVPPSCVRARLHS